MAEIAGSAWSFFSKAISEGAKTVAEGRCVIIVA